MTDIQKKLFGLSDTEYADFQARLTPSVEREKFIGVRVPKVRALAKELLKLSPQTEFLKALPHQYYDENMLHGLLISEIKDYDNCIAEVEKFLPFVDNWAVCDIMSPKIFKKNKEKLLEKIKIWSKSKHAYTIRFAIEMLMSHYLDGDFKPEYLKIPAAVKSDEYYVKMMIAWFFATALSKQWDIAVSVIENDEIKDNWTHNKTIQKACESYRITEEQKDYLRSLKR